MLKSLDQLFSRDGLHQKSVDAQRGSGFTADPFTEAGAEDYRDILLDCLDPAAEFDTGILSPCFSNAKRISSAPKSRISAALSPQPHQFIDMLLKSLRLILQFLGKRCGRISLFSILLNRLIDPFDGGMDLSDASGLFI